MLNELLIAFISACTGPRFPKGSHIYASGFETTIPTFSWYWICFLTKFSLFYSMLIFCHNFNFAFLCMLWYSHWLTESSIAETLSNFFLVLSVLVCIKLANPMEKSWRTVHSTNNFFLWYHHRSCTWHDISYSYSQTKNYFENTFLATIVSYFNTFQRNTLFNIGTL